MGPYRALIRRADVAPPLAAITVGVVLIAVLMPPRAHRQTAVEVPYYIATDAAGLIEPMVERFNREGGIEIGGRPIHVTPTVLPSGSAVSKILDQDLPDKPVAWTPGNSLWGGLLNARVGEEYVHGIGLPLVQSPQVVAILKKTAEGLGLTPSSSLKQILDLASRGDLKIGHTDPNVSTSGLAAVLSEFYLASGKRADGLMLADVRRDAVREQVRRYEASIVHYFDIGKTFRAEWCHYGAPFADAAYMQEAVFLDNDICRDNLMAIYPSDIPLVAEYRYIVLDAGWVSDEQAVAAKRFGTWLDAELASSCASVRANGFRRGDCVPAEVDGTQPRMPAPAIPKGDALEAVQESWGELRRPAHVMLIVDRSTRMGDSRLSTVRDAIVGANGIESPFVTCPEPQDEVGLIMTGGGTPDGVDEVVPLGEWPSRADDVGREIANAQTDRAGAALYDAIDRALSDPSMSKRAAINTIVVLAYGVDEASAVTPADLTERVRGLPVQIMLVPFGRDLVTGSQLTDINNLVFESLGRTIDHKADLTDASIVSRFICQFL